MQQSGDDPPPELQERLDQLANNFKEYDITPPTQPLATPPLDVSDPNIG